VFTVKEQQHMVAALYKQIASGQFCQCLQGSHSLVPDC